MTTKRRGSRSEVGRLVARIGAAVDRGANAAESIHKKAARLPLAALEGVEGLEGALKDLGRFQDRSIRAVYDLVRDVNHELLRIAEEAIEAVEAPRKRRPARARKPATAAARAA